MRNYYFYIIDNKRVLSEVYEGQVKSYNALNTTKILEKEINMGISNIKILEDNITVTFSNNVRITFEDKAIEKVADNYEALINTIRLKMKRYLEEEQLKKFRGTPKVNRHPKIKVDKLFIAASLGLTLLLGEKLMVDNLKDKKEVDTKPNMGVEVVAEVSEDKILDNVTYEPISTPEVITDEAPTLEEDYINIDLEFNDRSSSNKKDGVINYCGDIVSHYAKRWGLPEELILAQLTQESPNPDANGNIKNVCQLTSKYFIDQTFKVPVYNENGFTGTYDEFTCSAESINTAEGNVMAGLAYLRKCIDKCDSIITGLFLYNQGDSSLSLACKYYGVDIEEYKGDENAQKACELIVNYFNDMNRETGNIHGDPKYLEHIFSYMNLDSGGENKITGYVKDKEIKIAINNTLVYNNDLGR